MGNTYLVKINMGNTDLVKINMGNTFVIAQRCFSCGRLPDASYCSILYRRKKKFSKELPHNRAHMLSYSLFLESPNILNIFNGIYRGKCKLFKYHPKYHKNNKCNISESTYAICEDILYCKCSKTYWKFNGDNSSIETKNRKSRYNYR